MGALVGVNEGTITNSFSTGRVTGDKQLGGLVRVNFEGTVTNSFSTGAVSGRTGVGGVVGANIGGIIVNSFWNMDTSGLTRSVGCGYRKGAYGKNTRQMKQQATFTGWDFQAIWDIREGRTHPFHRWAGR